MFLTKKPMLKVFLFLVIITLIGALTVFTFYYSDISALNVPQNYRGVFI